MKRRDPSPGVDAEAGPVGRAWFRESRDGVLCRVRVSPNASANQITGIAGDMLGVRLTAPPVEGKANQALVRFLAEKLDVPRSAVKVVKGHTAREKTVLIAGIEADALRKLQD
jgi:uncharacterized protein